MKLAEALSLKKDLQKKTDQLSSRLKQNVKIQEGNEPTEQPEELLRVLSECLKQLEKPILKINITNLETERNEHTLTAMMAERDMLTKRTDILRETFSATTQIQDRYSRTEIKCVSTIDIRALNKRIDHFSQELRKLGMQIQATSFKMDLV